MAEALINSLGKGHYCAHSAGSFPTGEVHPKSLDTLERHNIEAKDPRSKSWDEFADTRFDLVITVCDQAEGETCPIFSANPKKLHWSTPDPAKTEGSEDDIQRSFNDAFLMLKDRVEGLVNGDD